MWENTHVYNFKDIFIINKVLLCLKKIKQTSESLGTLLKRLLVIFPPKTTSLKEMRICNFRDIFIIKHFIVFKEIKKIKEDSESLGTLLK